jgi:hypothetical protein
MCPTSVWQIPPCRLRSDAPALPTFDVTRRENQQRRRGPSRQPRNRVLVICGGERTEPDYLNGLKQWARNPAVRVTVVGRGKDPSALVDLARSRRQAAPEEIDEVWCVFDVDDFDVAPAVRAASAAGIEVAVSNPCFEVWLLMHHVDVRTPIVDAGAAVRRLADVVPGFDKCRLRFADFVSGVPDAIRRGQAGHDGSQPVGGNPSTGVWRLAQVVRGAERPPAPRS